MRHDAPRAENVLLPSAREFEVGVEGKQARAQGAHRIFLHACPHFRVFICSQGTRKYGRFRYGDTAYLLKMHIYSIRKG